MLGFILSLRAKALARNWDHTIWLLHRTLDSIVNQTGTEYKIVIACHDLPPLPSSLAARTHLVSVAHPLPERTSDDMCVDKVLKVTAGIDWAVAEGCTYVMFVDADDLVSNRLAEWVEQHEGANGWFLGSGYEYRYGSHSLRRREDAAHGICGTCAIVRTDLLKFAPDPVYRGQRVNTLAAVGHPQYQDLLRSQGFPLDPLPFRGSIYILHEDNISLAPGGARASLEPGEPALRKLRRHLSEAKHFIKVLPSLQRLTPAVRGEFAIPMPASVPEKI
jgi:hypothetical protein